ncbi:MAG: M23 family metallopeptidase [Solirubrobacteraceae bacterium]|nr:M23 family metallopeptidase [Solirubrobacteraceae bacterium]
MRRTPASTRLPSWFRLASRLRGTSVAIGMPLFALGFAALILPAGAPAAIPAAACAAGILLIAVGMPITLFPAAPEVQPFPIDPPLRGRWLIANSPADHVPSHGTHGLGQTWGIDFVPEPEPGSRPAFGTRGFDVPESYPGFGEPILAPAPGTVVSVSDGARDHRTRTSRPAVAFMLAEGMVRELFGARRLLGNHVVLDLGDGVYAALAHLQRGSVCVEPGQRIASGDRVGACGNSGNSSEPHLHFQLMDHPRPFVAAGLPFTLRRALGDRSAPPFVPGNDEVLDVPEAARPARSFELVGAHGAA